MLLNKVLKAKMWKFGDFWKTLHDKKHFDNSKHVMRLLIIIQLLIGRKNNFRLIILLVLIETDTVIQLFEKFNDAYGLILLNIVGNNNST